jgi:DNA repair protein RecO
MVFEGIVIHKVPYKERDLIVKLILRNGQMGSFYVYGGQGGGKNHKPSAFDLGAMMSIMVKDKKHHQEGAELLVASEYQRKWEPQEIRHHIQAFYLTCLYFEILQKLIGENEGAFSVISNALFYMDESLKKKDFRADQHLTLFMVKLIFHLGIMPDTDHCSYCGTDLMDSEGATFLAENGHFSCLQCTHQENEKGFLLRIKKGFQTKYQDYAELTGTRFQEADKLIHYFCHQFQLRPVELKSYGLLLRD